jgi:RNA polymerase sigma factor (sigma-70 family)
MTQAEFEHIAQELRPSMWKVGMDFFSSADDAEDVAQEALVQLWEYAEKLDATRNIGGLAIRIAKHCCIDMQRKRHTNVVELTSTHERAMNMDLSPHEKMEQAECIIADPLFQYGRCGKARFIPFPHEGYSGRIFRNDIPVFTGKDFDIERYMRERK